MNARRYEVTIKGVSPLLMHNDNLQWSDVMDQWKKDPANKKDGKAGDDRSPAWRWIGNLYTDSGMVCIPSDNLMTMLREGGARCPTGKGQKTFKAQTQSGIVVDQIAWPIVGPMGPIKYGPITELINNADFQKHELTAEALGFNLFVKRAKIGMAKHIRVRPRFDEWQATGTLTVFDDQITTDVLCDIITVAGAYCGLGDWRPSSPKSPGSFGKFTAEVKEIKK